MRGRLALSRALLALALFGSPEARGDDDAAALLDAPERAKDPEVLRRAAEEALEKSPKDPKALRALLLAVTALSNADYLDDAIARARALESPAGDALSAAIGAALLRRARMEDPPDPARLRDAATVLAFAEMPGAPAASLDLAYARHLLGDVPGATAAYERALDGDERTGERATKGLRSLVRDDPKAFTALAEPMLARHTRQPALRNALAVAAEPAAAASPAARGAGLAYLDGHPWAGPETPRTLVLRAGWLRDAGRHADALPLERDALARAGDDLGVEASVERLWRERRPLASFADCDEIDRDYATLLGRAAGDALRHASYANNLAFRFREVVSTYTWRGEGRTQGIAEGAPKEATALLRRCVALYDEGVAAIPKDAMDRPFGERWVYAGVLNDAGLMRHYFVDTRDLGRAEALYLRAFELTDGAYMDTYFYNLQYLYGFEKPGNEEAWFRLAQRASERILKEGKDGSLEPDERKRDAARRDAAALKRLLEDREKRK